MHIDPTTIADIEFGICLQSDTTQEYYRVPVVQAVKDALSRTLEATVSMLQGNSPRPYEPSQIYKPDEHLHVRLDAQIATHIRELYTAVNTIPLDPRAMNNPAALRSYFAIFRFADGRVIMGMKRATHFKAVVRARNRLLHIGPEALEPVKENVFRLDHEFDFFTDHESITILHPSGFEQIADTEHFIRMGAADAVAELSEKLWFIDFSSIADYVAHNLRGAKLVASIRMRDDLDKIVVERLMAGCKRVGVDLVEHHDSGLFETRKTVTPIGAHIPKFLEYLDNRLYTDEAIAEPTHSYLARNRHKIYRRRRTS